MEPAVNESGVNESDVNESDVNESPSEIRCEFIRSYREVCG